MKLKTRILRNLFVNELRTFIKWWKYRPMSMFPHGHFYSPIVSKSELKKYARQIWPDTEPNYVLGIDMNDGAQLSLLKEFARYYPEMPFEYEKSDKNRYCFNNDSFEHTDAIILYSFIRHFRPRRILEIGCGYSSAVMLDTREMFAQDIQLTFIEPFPKLLYKLFRNNDENDCTVMPTQVQKVDIDLFRELQSNDILFIDSSHVSKIGSDVNHELFQILPNLNAGVLIHFHDIFYPFEYPQSWAYAGRNWNENYLLRAFMSYNNSFEILHFAQYIHKHHKRAFETMPLAYENLGGSFWIRKISSRA